MNGAGIYDELILDIAKIFIAMLCGGIIGFERQLKDKPAGLRTNILVSIGSCLFVILSLKVSEIYDDDPGRIIGPIITGIGFLGAGTIIQAKGSVRGLTSAATIWVVAGAGMCAGLELFNLALIISLSVFFILFILGRMEGTISLFGFREFELVVISKSKPGVLQKIRRTIKQMGIGYNGLRLVREKGMLKIIFYAYGRQEDLTTLISRLLEHSEVIEARLESI